MKTNDRDDENIISFQLKYIYLAATFWWWGWQLTNMVNKTTQI